ncbi:MAG TPA: ATP-binding cassette domain-containing protein, partial [Pseudolabrys sp.]|nr:ATP-binding cassette domain-containing protein [Pseudolabrys sp.]
MAADPALVLDGVTKRFGGLAVTQDIRFDVPAGARTALIGPNGAGKTTLFNLVSGVYKIDAGRILLDGRPIHDLPPRKRV